MKRYSLSAPIALVCLLTTSTWAADWPQFRYDAGRTAASPHELPAQMQVLWTRTLPPPRPAFPHEVRLAFDASYEPVVLGNTMLVPSMVTDCVTALDTETGEERWRFIAEGPVRFAPVAWEGKVYFVSDDGHLYCLDAADGSLRWKFRGLPEERQDRKVVGNGRLISLWPARGGPVLVDGVVYFAAGLWPTEGVFIHALDAQSGEPVWSNTESHHIPASNWDHGIGFDAGLTPQGYLAVVGDKLVVPCGTQLPAFLDPQTGKLGDYTMGWGGRVGLPKGCWFVAGIGSYLSHGGDLYDITRPYTERVENPNYGRWLYPGGWTRLEAEPANQRELDAFRQPVFTAGAMYESDRDGILARDLTSVALNERSRVEVPPHRSDDTYPDTFIAAFEQLWRLPARLDLHIKAGGRLYAGGPGVVAAVDPAAEDGPKVVWRAEIDGTPHRMLAAGGKLFVVTTEGAILAFGAPHAGEVARHAPPIGSPPPTDAWTQKTADILEATGVRDGFALVLGIDRGRLVEELARQSDLHVIAVDADAEKIAVLRRQFHTAGLYGKRVALLVGHPAAYPFPPYLANLVVSEDPDRLPQADEQALAEAVFQVLRPYGGVACTWGSLAAPSRIEQIVQDEAFAGATVREAGNFVLLSRSGPLPGAADWSHAGANAANTGASEDDFVRSPMNVLWFDASQRWHKYPGQIEVRVAGGRLILLEEGGLRASDVYTGRRLWEVAVPVGAEPRAETLARDAAREARQRHWGPPPSLSPATQLVVLEDAVYISDGRRCVVLDAATGVVVGRIDLPDDLDAPWMNLTVHDDRLIGTSGRHVLCMHRSTGELIWRVEMDRAGLSLAVGGDKVFCAEMANRRRGEDETRDGTTRALDLRTGETVWRKAGGAPLRYSEPLDLVVTPGGLFRGADGAPAAQPATAGPNRWIVEGRGLPEGGLPGVVAGQRLLTGNEQLLVVYDLPKCEPAGKPLEWVRRGCTGTRASTHLLTTRYRSNSAWIDLATREITPMLGVRPGCAVNNNLYPANGVLNMPNLTGGCTCNFAPASLALVPAAVLNGDPNE